MRATSVLNAQALTYCHHVPNDCCVVEGVIGSDRDKRNRSTDLFLLHQLLVSDTV